LTGPETPDEHRGFKVEIWSHDDNNVVEVMCISNNLKVARAAYEATIPVRPGRPVKLRQGIRLIAEHPGAGAVEDGMCGRFAQFTSPDEIRRLFNTKNAAPNAEPRWNAAPSHDLMVVRRHPETGHRHLDVLHWGLIPSWAKDRKIAFKMINTRCETAATSGAFRKAWAKRRCLVPADAFYEWELIDKQKMPQAFAMASRLPFALGALWEWWKDPESGEEVRSFTIVTTRANPLINRIHDRMPVIIAPEHYDLWLSPDDAPPSYLVEPFSDDLMTSWAVSPLLNSPKNNTADLINSL
jgi:putative SOS response-associated peptidase YedK